MRPHDGSEENPQTAQRKRLPDLMDVGEGALRRADHEIVSLVVDREALKIFKWPKCKQIGTLRKNGILGHTRKVKCRDEGGLQHSNPRILIAEAVAVVMREIKREHPELIPEQGVARFETTSVDQAEEVDGVEGIEDVEDRWSGADLLTM
eukprot:IDg9897t1